MQNKLASLLKSRKFWAALISVGTIVANNVLNKPLPFTDEQITGVVAIAIAYILGTALEDGLSAGR